MHRTIQLVAAGLLLATLAAAPAAAEELTYSDLVGRLTDLGRLAVLPEAGETCRQWSSYDRASQYDQTTKKYLRWDANGDGSGIIRAEGDRVVMAEMDGPGCIWRIWSAAADKGHVKIYLDGQAEPAVDLPFFAYFDGKHKPFDYPVLSYNLNTEHSSGQNLYLPIPYQKSCKIVADKGWGNYYHFNYATYPKGTRSPITARRWTRRTRGTSRSSAGTWSRTCRSSSRSRRASRSTIGTRSGPFSP